MGFQFVVPVFVMTRTHLELGVFSPYDRRE